ncbi:Regulator of Vps4 activity in the MVB pathway protein [Hirschfeldia incana]|nr:Regulator of Vps4 activity in the MVB pathway protein [Hirschfeldia incana]
MNIFLKCFKPKFYKKSKSATSHMKIRIDIVRKRRIAMVKFWKTDIVEFLKNGLDYDAYTRAELLLEELRIISCYDIIERFCDCISENLPLMRRTRECPEECREAVSSLIYAAAWVPDVPELKDLRAVFMRRFGNFTASSVNYELVEKTELRKRPSRELKIQTVKDIAKEFSIDWDPTALNLLLLRQSSALQIEEKVETGAADDPKNERKKSIVNDQSDDETVHSQTWTRDSLSNHSLSSSSSSSFGSPRRDSEQKKKKRMLPYGIISSPNTKPGARKDEKGEEEKLERKKSTDQENPRLLKPQGTDNEASSVREKEKTSSLQRLKLLHYDDVVSRLTSFRRG